MERETIDTLTRRLPVSRRRRDAISRELQSHLEDARRDLELAGWHPEDAHREVVARMGDPAEVFEEFSAVYRPRRRLRLGIAFALAGSMLLGAYGIGGTLASARAAQHPAHHAVQRHARSAHRP